MVGDTLVLNADFLPVSVLPLSTMIWQDAIKAFWLDNISVLENYEHWTARSPSVELPVPSIVMTRAYVHVPHGVQFCDDNILLRDRYRCQYCGVQVSPYGSTRPTMDHVLPRTFGGRDTWDNLTTACSPCNSKKGSDFRIKPKIMPYRPSYYELVEKRREFPLIVPDQKWVEYLNWPEDKVIVKPPKKTLPKNPVLMAAE